MNVFLLPLNGTDINVSGLFPLVEVVQQIEWSGGGLFEKLTFYSIKLGFEQGLNESRPHPEASLLYSGERRRFSTQLDRVEGTPPRAAADILNHNPHCVWS